MSKCKKNRARLVSVVVLIAVISSLILCNPILVNAETDVVEKDGVYYRLSENGNYYEVIGYDKTLSIVDVVIPSAIRKCKVKAISEGAFENCKTLERVTLPKSFYSIGDSAFLGCTSLESISMPSSVYYIGVSAFENCRALANIVLPSSLKKVSDRTFLWCYSLKSVTIPINCTSIGAQAFCDCISLSTVKFETDSKLQEISRLAFYGCDMLTAINVPKSVETIGDYAFDSCERLTTVVLREGLKKIGIFAFVNCAMEMVEIPQSVEEMGYYCVGFYVPSLSTQVIWVNGFTIYGLSGSVAETYAEVFGFNFSYGSPVLLGIEDSSNGVKLSFRGNYNEDGVYRVYRRTADTVYELIGEVKATNSVITFTDKDVLAGEGYKYTVEFVDSNGMASRRNKDGLTITHLEMSSSIKTEDSNDMIRSDMNSYKKYIKNFKK